MLQINLRGIETVKIVTLSNDLLYKLQKIIGCPRDYFTIEVL